MGREVGRHRKKGRVIRSGRETGMKHKRTERGEARPTTSPLEKRKEKELHLHLGPEGAPWGQPSEMRALWIAVNSFSVQFYESCSIFTLPCVHSTNLSTGPPRPPRPAGSYLLLVSGSRERVNKNKGVSVDVRKRRSSVLLSVAAKLRVVAERDLQKGQKWRITV